MKQWEAFWLPAASNNELGVAWFSTSALPDENHATFFGIANLKIFSILNSMRTLPKRKKVLFVFLLVLLLFVIFSSLVFVFQFPMSSADFRALFSGKNATSGTDSGAGPPSPKFVNDQTPAEKDNPAKNTDDYSGSAYPRRYSTDPFELIDIHRVRVFGKIAGSPRKNQSGHYFMDVKLAPIGQDGAEPVVSFLLGGPDWFMSTRTRSTWEASGTNLPWENYPVSSMLDKFYVGAPISLIFDIAPSVSFNYDNSCVWCAEQKRLYEQGCKVNSEFLNFMEGLKSGKNATQKMFNKLVGPVMQLEIEAK